MSGTSMDGIDVALIETDGQQQIKEIAHTSISYDPSFKVLLKAAEYSVQKHQGNLEEAKKHFKKDLQNYLIDKLKLQKLNLSKKTQHLSAYIHKKQKLSNALTITFDEVIQHSTKLHSEAVKQLLEENNLYPNKIDIIGYHGQTLFHNPTNKTIVQIGDGQRLANSTGITVVNDFRSCDVAMSGQGAPFAPLYHQALAIRDKKLPLAVVNCGGIANISLICGATEKDVLGFDTGPGNCLIDFIIRQHTRGKETMDKDGQRAQQGKVNEKILQELYDQAIIKNGKNYFLLPLPKSLDTNDIKLTKSFEKLSLEDACATLAAFTADTIVKSLHLSKIKPTYWVLSGGGWKNPVILNELKRRLTQEIPNVKIMRADEMGWNDTAMEAQIFAYLAVRSLKKLPLSYPSTTGVKEPLSGGYVYLAENYKPTTEVAKFLATKLPANII